MPQISKPQSVAAAGLLYASLSEDKNGNGRQSKNARSDQLDREHSQILQVHRCRQNECTNRLSGYSTGSSLPALAEHGARR
jgi:hypothetical protein